MSRFDSYENAQIRIFENSEIMYGIPILEGIQTYEPCEFIPFNYAKSCKDPWNKGIHFNIDDYQFDRLWNNPAKYLDLLREFKYVCTPDFSMYTDFPKALSIFSHYKKHWLGAYWEENGINVIPTICWAGEYSYDYCFLGEPKNGIVTVSSVGVCRSKELQEKFMHGWDEMVKRLNPHTVLFIGNPINGLTQTENMNIIFVENANARRIEAVRANYNFRKEGR